MGSERRATHRAHATRALENHHAPLRSTCIWSYCPFVVDGAIRGDIFLEWTRSHLIKEFHAGDIVIMDNLSSHKIAGVVDSINSVGARVRYLPPYSPDLNPIENMFAKLKHVVRKNGARMIDALWAFIGKSFDFISQQECLNYIRHAGYT